jgi:transcriptional regulator of acetoin/glycerol metabolism
VTEVGTDVIATGVDGQIVLRSVRIRVVDGPDRGLTLDLERGTAIVGKGVAADLRLDDRKTSRAHAELVLLGSGVRVRDLGSTNGTMFRGARLEGALTLRPPFELEIGQNRLEITTVDTPLLAAPTRRVPLPLGPSATARGLRESLGRIADRQVAVCVYGEPGAGKTSVAVALARACAAPITRVILGPSLERAALADAIARAEGGALLIDDLHAGNTAQHELLRAALEEREAGRARFWPIATSSIDPRELAEDGRLPRSLFFLIATVRVALPRLAERPEDAHELASSIAAELGAPPELAARAVAELAGAGFPDGVWGVRRAIAAAMTLASPGDETPVDELWLPYKEAKARMVEGFTERYVRELLERHDGNISRAAEEAGIARQHLTALARRYGVER